MKSGNRNSQEELDLITFGKTLQNLVERSSAIYTARFIEKGRVTHWQWICVSERLVVSSRQSRSLESSVYHYLSRQIIVRVFK